MSLPTLDDGNKNRKKDSSLSLPDFDMPPIESDEDEFKSVPVEDALYNSDDTEENGEIYEEVERKEVEPELPKVEENEDMLLQDENDYNPDYKEDLKAEEEKKNEFIDKKNKKLIPFGGKKSNKKKKVVKSSDFDERKNKLAKTKVIQFSILSIVAILFLVGLKNTFLPSHVYSDQQIRQFAAEGAGQTGFPSERGKAYVESFMEVYLSIDRSKAETPELLGYFYGEDRIENSSYAMLNMEWPVDTKQTITIEPKVFDVKLLTEYSAQYKVSTYVSDTDGNLAEGTESTGRWLSFSVNVYYDIESDSLIITPDSPTLIPEYKVTNQTVVPERHPLGNGVINREIEPTLAPTINGFIEAYSKSSLDSHDSVVQYINDQTNNELISGFGGKVELNGSSTEAIKRVVYDNDDNSYRVDVTVNWKDKTATEEDKKLEYTARYLMTIIPTGNGKYAVSSFVPYTYYK